MGVKPTFFLWYAELKELRLKNFFVKNIYFPGKVLLKSFIGVFNMINSYLSRCKALWSLTAFEVKVLSFVTIW